MSAESTVALQDGFRRTGLTTTQLWLASVGIGGALKKRDIEAITSGSRAATAAEHDIVAAALNDHFVGKDEDHPVVFWRDLPCRDT